MANNTLLQVTKDYMGEGDIDLGHMLLKNYFTIRNNDNNLPKIMVFFNSAVKLLVEDSPCLEIFKEIEAKGVKIISCKTCLSHFDILDKVAVGTPGTMVDIISLQDEADKIISL
jgi:selenium metabolism protein YedF